MENKRSFEAFYGYVMAFFAVLLILLPKMILFGFVAFLVLVIVGVKKKKLHFRLDTVGILFSLLYLFYVGYSFASRHSDVSNSYIENKLSFLLLPVLFAFRPKERVSFYWPIVAYVSAVAILVLQSCIAGINCYLHGGGKACFLASLFSYQHHPSYSTVYLAMALGLLVYGYRARLRGFKLFWIVPFAGLLVLVSMLFLSLAGILFLMGLSAVVVLVLIAKKWGKIVGALAALVAPVLVYFTIISIPQVEGEWTNAKWYADQYLKDPQAFIAQRQYPMSGTEVRIVMWTVASTAIKKFPMGVGTGNVDEVLGTHLRAIHQPEMAKEKLNPHNQFLQTTLELGWLGLILLFGLIVAGIRYAFRAKNWLLLMMTINLFFNCLFESMLQRQSGIVFYAFILLVLIAASENQRKRIKQETVLG